jgi:hypothetical protein
MVGISWKQSINQGPECSFEIVRDTSLAEGNHLCARSSWVLATKYHMIRRAMQDTARANTFACVKTHPDYQLFPNAPKCRLKWAGQWTMLNEVTVRSSFWKQCSTRFLLNRTLQVDHQLMPNGPNRFISSFLAMLASECEPTTTCFPGSN